MGRIIDQWLLEEDIQVHEKMELDTLEAIAAMVMNNLGVSIVPMSCCSKTGNENLNVIPLNDNSLSRVLGVLCRRDTSKHTLIDLLWNKLINIVEEAEKTKA